MTDSRDVIRWDRYMAKLKDGKTDEEFARSCETPAEPYYECGAMQDGSLEPAEAHFDGMSEMTSLAAVGTWTEGQRIEFALDLLIVACVWFVAIHLWLYRSNFSWCHRQCAR